MYNLTANMANIINFPDTTRTPRTPHTPHTTHTTNYVKTHIHHIFNKLRQNPFDKSGKPAFPEAAQLLRRVGISESMAATLTIRHIEARNQDNLSIYFTFRGKNICATLLYGKFHFLVHDHDWFLADPRHFETFDQAYSRAVAMPLRKAGA